MLDRVNDRLLRLRGSFVGRLDRFHRDQAVRLALSPMYRDTKDGDAMSYFILGRIHLIRREYDLSISALRNAIDLNPYLSVATMIIILVSNMGVWSAKSRAR